MIVSMEKLSDMSRATPGRVAFSKLKSKKKKRAPTNLATGLYSGTTLMVESYVVAATGLVTQPIRGAKADGMKGATRGVGKGVLGLVCKPVAGTLDFVT